MDEANDHAFVADKDSKSFIYNLFVFISAFLAVAVIARYLGLNLLTPIILCSFFYIFWKIFKDQLDLNALSLKTVGEVVKTTWKTWEGTYRAIFISFCLSTLSYFANWIIIKTGNPGIDILLPSFNIETITSVIIKTNTEDVDALIFLLVIGFIILVWLAIYSLHYLAISKLIFKKIINRKQFLILSFVSLFLISSFILFLISFSKDIGYTDFKFKIGAGPFLLLLALVFLISGLLQYKVKKRE